MRSIHSRNTMRMPLSLLTGAFWLEVCGWDVLIGIALGLALVKIYLAMPARSARKVTASTKETLSISCRNLKTSPPTPQPKQW